MTSRTDSAGTRAHHPRLRSYLVGRRFGLVTLALMLLLDGVVLLAPSTSPRLRVILLCMAVGLYVVLLGAAAVGLSVSGPRVRGRDLLTGAILTLLALGAWLLLPFQLDAMAMNDLISHDLPLGSSVAQVTTFLHSRDLRRFASGHQLVETSDDQGPPQRVARYDPRIVGLQVFPGGQSLFVNMTSVPYGKLLSLQFTFDGHGRLTRYTVDEGWAGI